MRRNGSAVVEGSISKREKLQNRENAYRNLPFSFDGTQGPTAWRRVRNPSQQMVAADLKAQSIERMLAQYRRANKGKKPSRKQMRRLIYQWEVANGMESGR